jgi:IS30 family transposase
VVLAKVMDRSATSYIQATVAAFARHALGLPMRSFTVDHGMAFAKFPELEAACGARVYFAQP